MVFLTKQTACDGSIFSTVAAGPPLMPEHLFISLSVRISAYLCLAPFSVQEVYKYQGREPLAAPDAQSRQDRCFCLSQAHTVSGENGW